MSVEAPVRTAGPTPVGPPPKGVRIGLVVGALLAEVAGLAVVAFCWFVAGIATFGLFGGDPRLDSFVILPMLGVAVASPLGPLVMSLGDQPRRWRIVAALVSGLSVLVVSAFTWLPVALGLH